MLVERMARMQNAWHAVGVVTMQHAWPCTTTVLSIGAHVTLVHWPRGGFCVCLQGQEVQGRLRLTQEHTTCPDIVPGLLGRFGN